MRDDVLEVRQLAGAAPQIDRAVAHDGDARRVVAAIFEPPQPLDEDRDDFLRADVSDDPAHSCSALALLRFLSPSFVSTQPSMFRCLPALTASAPAGTFSRTVVPLPT